MRVVAGLVLLLFVAGVLFFVHGRSVWVPIVQKITGRQTVADVLVSTGPQARKRLLESFNKAGVAYPPQQVTLLAIKSTSVLELWAGPQTNPVFISEYNIRAASGVNGPKLREGDKQVPEGLYKIIGLNPNSSFHLSLKLNYPNQFDLRHAVAEGRSSPGSDIFIHGKAKSVGCLAMGDAAIEELFVLSADIGMAGVNVVIAPTDPREKELSWQGFPGWVQELYQNIGREFSYFIRRPPAR